LWVLTVDPIAAQTEPPGKVIERHIDTIGGKKVIESAIPCPSLAALGSALRRG
jgi:hypothetical protein